MGKWETICGIKEKVIKQSKEDRLLAVKYLEELDISLRGN